MQLTAPASAGTYWTELARGYDLLGPPLKPSSDDVRAIQSAVARGAPGGELRALMLGVTPALAGMRWPEGCSLVAADASFAMVQSVFPWRLGRRREAICADWRGLPFRSGSCDVVVGDGSLNCLPYPAGYRALATEVSRLLTRRGTFVARCYIQPDERESPEAVAAAVGAMPSFHHYKFRLMMALQRTAREGIAVDEVYRFWASHIGRHAIPAGPGWEPEVVQTIERYRGTETVHTFPTLAELRAALHGVFDEAGLSVPSYPLGERCPTLVWRPRRP
jgi:SAM-dependent methyltransferase